MSGPFVSVVTPVFNEAGNLAEFHAQLRGCLDSLRLRWEWIAVDDCSTDDSAAVLRRIGDGEENLRVFTHGRNLGSHAAILRGLHEARGGAAVALAADLQDPPEIIAKLLEAWRGGAALVWAARTRASGGNARDRFCSSAFHLAVRLWTGLPAPRYGADCFLADRRVLDEAARWRDPGPNLFFRLLALPVPQRHVPHDRQPRAHGRSGWTMTRKLRLAITSLLAFTSPKSWLLRARGILWRAGQALAAPGGALAITGLVREWLATHAVTGGHLDVGCGARSRLAAAGVQPVGVDSDAARVAAIIRDGGTALVAPSTRLPFADGAFGAVWSFGLLHHLDDAELEQSLGEMERVAKPGGWIVVFDAVPPRSGWRRPLAALVRALDKGRHMRTEEKLRAALATHGEWECRRVTYALNGLEALFCCRHKPSEQTQPAPCPSPPTSN